MHFWLVESAIGNAAAATALALLAALLGPFWRKPAVRHALWLLVLVKLITPPLGRIPLIPELTFTQSHDVKTEAASPPSIVLEPTLVSMVEIPIPETSALDAPDVANTTPPPLSEPTPAEPAVENSSDRLHISSLVDPKDALVALWLAGALAWWMIAVARLARLMQGLRAAAPAPDGIADRLRTLAFDLGLRRVPELRFVEAAISPFVCALGGRAIVVVPSALWNRLDDAQRDALLLHELAHLRRGDPWVRLVELAATSLFWWLPTLWLVRRALHAAEEQACDAWVVATRPTEAKSYATALIETVDFLSRAPRLSRWAPVPIASSGLGRLSHVRRRIIMVMKARVSPRLSRVGKLGLLGLGLSVLPWLPGLTSPSSGQDPDGEPPIVRSTNRTAPGDLEDERMDLMSQLRIRAARTKRAQAMLNGARDKFERLGKIANQTGTVESSLPLTEASTALEVAEADLEIARAEQMLIEERLQRLDRQVRQPEVQIRAEIKALEERIAEVSRLAKDPEAVPMIRMMRNQLAVRETDLDQLMARMTDVDQAEPNSRTDMASEMKKAMSDASAVRSDRMRAAQQARTINSLKQIGIALHTYLDAHGTFPPQASADKQGSPLLSWRVAILPFLDQSELYNKFHLDEPWDSEHNKELINEMPDVFRSFDANGKQGETRFQSLVGGDDPRTVINFPRATKIEEITDGTSNTIAVIEAAGSVPWTKPDDLVPQGNEDEAVGRKTYEDGFLALIADGSVRPIPGKIPQELFKAMFTIQGGEVIDWVQLDQRASETPVAIERATGRLSIPGPAGSNIEIQVPVDVEAGSDEERAMKIAAEIARMLAARLQEHGEARPPTEAETQERRQSLLAEKRLAEMKAEYEQAAKSLAAARDAERMAKERAEARESKARQVIQQFQREAANTKRNAATQEAKPEKLDPATLQQIDDLLDKDAQTAVSALFDTILERGPTVEELQRATAVFENAKAPKRELLENLARELLSYRGEK